MNEVSIISTVAICVCGAFITGSVAFVIKSLMNDIKQAEITAEKGIGIRSVRTTWIKKVFGFL